MKRARPLSWHWLWLLFLLLGVLAAFQYRWLGEVSRAEKQRAESLLRDSAESFANAFDLEVSRLFFSFQTGESDDVFARIAQWRAQAPFPSLLQGVLQLQRDAEGLHLLRADEETQTLEPIPWSSNLEPLRLLRNRRPRRGLTPNARTPARSPGSPLLRKPLSLVLFGHPVVLLLDHATLAQELAPSLVERYFPEGRQPDYDVALFDRASSQLVYSSNRSISPEQFQELPELPSLLTVRRFEALNLDLETLSRRSGFGTPRRFGPPLGRRPGALSGAPPGRPGDLGPPGLWALRVLHQQGSLERAIGRLHLRNLGISIGILLLLATSGGFLVLATRRAQALARQQIEFVAGLTHELHTPLAAIAAAGDNLADGVVSEQPKIREYGGLIQREGRRLSELVGQALELAGLRSGHRSLQTTRLELGELLDESIADNQWLIDEHSTRIELDLPADLPPIRADRLALRRAFSNLLGNAIKYGAGSVVVQARERQKGLCVSISDDGPGIAEADLPLVFEPFFRGESVREGAIPGSGVGLYLVRELIERHGGSVTAHSAPSGGSVFEVVLPPGAPPTAEEKA